MYLLNSKQTSFLKKIRYRIKQTVGNKGHIFLIHEDYPNRKLYKVPTILHVINKVLMDRKYSEEERKLLMDLRVSVKWNVIDISQMKTYWPCETLSNNNIAKNSKNSNKNTTTTMSTTIQQLKEHIEQLLKQKKSNNNNPTTPTQRTFRQEYQQQPLPNPSDSFRDIVYGSPLIPNTQTTPTNTQTIRTDLSYKQRRYLKRILEKHRDTLNELSKDYIKQILKRGYYKNHERKMLNSLHNVLNL